MGFKLFGQQIGRTAEQKHEEKMAKIEARESIVSSREETKQTAWEKGLDPNASKWAGISSLGNSASQGLSSIFGKGGNPTGSAFGTTATSNPMVLILLAVLVIFMMKGKK